VNGEYHGDVTGFDGLPVNCAVLTTKSLGDGRAKTAAKKKAKYATRAFMDCMMAV
jgi:hypothetical protein